MNRPRAYVIFSQHFDLMWRRCFWRDFIDKGDNYVSYADLQAFYIIDHIALCEAHSEHKFVIESVAVLREFLRTYPEYRETVQKLFDTGRLSVPAAGDNIIDSNMVNGESIVRNYLYGNRYLKEEFGYVPRDVFDRNDAFGNSAQLPQIARAFGCRFIANLSYSVTDAPYWRGLDGSTVYVGEGKGIPTIGTVGGYYKYRPCPACRGMKNIECPVCRNRRIDEPFTELRRGYAEGYEKRIGKEKDGVPGVIFVQGEEFLPVENIYTWIAEQREKYDFTVIQYDDYAKAIKEKLDRVDEVGDREIHSSPEVNPNNTGVLVSRIRTKQTVRENEVLMAKAECLSAIRAVNGKGSDGKLYRKLWEKLHFTMFHDAITGTHIDAAYDELMEVARRLRDALTYDIEKSARALAVKEEGRVTVINTTGVTGDITVDVPLRAGEVLVSDAGMIAPVIARRDGNAEVFVGRMEPFDCRRFTVKHDGRPSADVTWLSVKKHVGGDAVLVNTTGVAKDENDGGKRYTIENEYYTVTASDRGILSVFDKRLGKTVAEKSEYFVGEYILEHDLGSPWTTLSRDRRREPLSANTRVSRIEKGADSESISFTVKGAELAAYSVNGVEINYTVRLVRGLSRLLFTSDIFFDTANHRLRVAFPTPLTGKHIYEIPYGILERAPYADNIVFPDGSSNWAAATGDYPALRFAGVSGDGGSVALFNTGTPAYKIDKDEKGAETIYLSLLRSPTVGTYLHDPSVYSMTAYEGMRDAGQHSFSYAFGSYGEVLPASTAIFDGITYNQTGAVLCGSAEDIRMPRLVSDNAYIASVKCSEDGKMLVYRVVEYRGKDGSFRLDVPENRGFGKAYLLGMDESILSELSGDTPIGKFKIFTVGIRLA